MSTREPEGHENRDAGREEMVLGDLPAWGRPLLDDMMDTLLSGVAPFPCTFAVSAARRSTLRFAFVADLEDPVARAGLAATLRRYLDEYQELSRDTSFVAIFRPEECERTLDEYHAVFWSILQFLHDADPAPWPADVPADPEDPWWEFSFAGTPIFVVCNTPAHKARASRHSPSFTITFQPRWVFEEIGPESRQGRAARKVIRQRLAAFDAVPASPALGDYGSADNREWRQYFLPDSVDRPPGRCPFHPSGTPDSTDPDSTGPDSTGPAAE